MSVKPGGKHSWVPSGKGRLGDHMQCRDCGLDKFTEENREFWGNCPGSTPRDVAKASNPPGRFLTAEDLVPGRLVHK